MRKPVPEFLEFLKMKVGYCSIKFILHGARSLKEKRRVIKTIKDRVKNKFNVSIAEDGGQDVWGALHLGIAVVGSDSRYLEGLMSQTVNFIDLMYLADITEHQTEVIHLKSD